MGSEMCIRDRSSEKGSKRRLHEWFERAVKRVAQVSTIYGEMKSSIAEEDEKARFLLTCQHMDALVQLVSQCETRRDEIAKRVRAPAAFIENYTQPSIVVVDETPLWTQPRAEDRLILPRKFTSMLRQRRRRRRLIEAAQEGGRAEEVEVASRCEGLRGLGSGRSQARQYTRNTGSKYRLTLVNVAYIRGWFDPERDVGCCKDYHMLIVKAALPCRLDDIDDEHRWVRDVTLNTSEGKVHFRRGQTTKLLYRWVEERARLSR